MTFESSEEKNKLNPKHDLVYYWPYKQSIQFYLRSNQIRLQKNSAYFNELKLVHKNQPTTPPITVKFRMTERKHYRPDVDALRGISILIVVIFHAYPKLLTGGFVGVDVFFIISGFLITQILYEKQVDGKLSLIDFYSRRIKRLFPTLLVVLLTALILGYLLLFSDEYKHLGYHAYRSSIFLQNFTLIKELGYFDVSSTYKPLLHLWSLSIEEQFYFIWPLLLITLLALRVNPLLIIAFVSLASFFANIYFVQNYKDEVFFHLSTRAWELGLGSSLALIVIQVSPIKIVSPPLKKILFFTGIVLIFFASFRLTDRSLYPSWYGLFPTIGACLVIFSHVKFKYWFGLRQLGLISYPLYLWHWVVISFLYIYLGNAPTSPQLIGAIAFSVILATLTFLYIEPIRYNQSKTLVLMLVLVAVAIALSGRYIYKNDGLPQRSHLKYLQQYNIQFTRTPAKDPQCEQYVASFLGQKEKAFHYCRAEISGKSKKIAIIGDSHAHAFFPGIADTAKKHGYDTLLFANSSCPPLEGFEWGKNPQQISKCQVSINQIMEIIKKDQQIKSVIMLTRGPVYIHGEVPTKMTKENILKSLNTMANKNLTHESYFKGFEKTIRKLNSYPNIKHIFYYLENPELDFLPKEQLPRPIEITSINRTSTTINKELYDLRMNKYISGVTIIEKKYAKLKVIDVRPYFCPQNQCISFMGKDSLYADDDHISIFGSYFIAKNTEQIIF